MIRLLVLLAIASLANAGELQFNLSGDVPGSVSPFSASFTLDTSSGVTSILDGATVTRDASFSNISLLVNGQSILAAPSLTGAYNFSGGYASLSLWVDPQSFFFWQNILTDRHFAVGSQPSTAEFYSHGALVDYLQVDSVTVTALAGAPPVDVPEPGTLALFALGLALIGLRNYRRLE